nr:hypothetical protein [uncultured Eisenbergiella sp.]
MFSVLRKKYPNCVWNIAYFVGILIFIMTQINNVAGPVIMPDEVGYWASGAFLAGNDWSGIMSMSPYYGFGYGIFLGIIMHFVRDPIIMFKTAVVLNGIFLYVIYCFTYRILTILKVEWDGRVRKLISFVVTFYTFNIYYSLNSEAEILQVVVYLFLCYLVLQCNKTRKKFEIRMIIIPLLAVFMVACHQRNLGVVVALSFWTLLMLLFKKISVLSFFSFVVTMGVVLIIFFELKQIINQNIFLVSSYTTEEADKVSGALGIFTLKGFKSFVECVSGRFFYLGCVSFLLVYRGMGVILRDVVVCLKKRRRGLKNRFLLFQIFISLTLFAEIAIGSLAFLGNEKRIDGFLYGRYNEHILIPILLYGFISYRTFKDNTKIQIVSSIVLLSLGVYVNYIYMGYNTIETSTHSISAMIGMPIFQNVNESNIQMVYSVGVAQFSLLISWFLHVFLVSTKRKLQVTGIIMTVSFWIFFGINALHLYFFNFTDYNRELYSFASQVLETVDKDSQIYYLIDREKEAVEPSSSTWLMYRIQFFLTEKKIEVIDIKEMNEQIYILVYKNSSENNVLSKMGYKYLIEGERMILYSRER